MPTHCERCFKETRVTKMSFFNTDMCCMECINKERQHPEFERARQAEIAQVKAGNYNFAGIGKPEDL